MKKDFKDELGKQEAEQPRSPSRCGNFKAQGWWLPRQAKMTRPTDTQKVIDQIESHAAIVREQKLHAEIKRLRAWRTGVETALKERGLFTFEHSDGSFSIKGR